MSLWSAMPSQTKTARSSQPAVSTSTDDEYADIQQSLGEELNAIIPKRAAIEQAKGMLMALYVVNEDAAFSILRWRSQQLNVKLSTIALRPVADLPGLLQVDPSNRAPVDRYLMSRPPV